MVFVVRLGLETGFASVSSTQFAVGSPVITGMLRPRPGSAIRRARRMMALEPSVFCMISRDTSVGRVTLVLLVEIPLIVVLLSKIQLIR